MVAAETEGRAGKADDGKARTRAHPRRRLGPGDMSWERLEETGADLLRRLGPGALRAVAERATAGWPRDAILRHAPDADPLLDALADTDRSAALAYLTGLAAGYSQRAGEVSVLGEAHVVGQLHIGQADPDVRGIVHQPLAADHPRMRVRHQPALPPLMRRRQKPASPLAFWPGRAATRAA
jgi:hypothetical protein